MMDTAIITVAKKTNMATLFAALVRYSWREIMLIVLNVAEVKLDILYVKNSKLTQNCYVQI